MVLELNLREPQSIQVYTANKSHVVCLTVSEHINNLKAIIRREGFRFHNAFNLISNDQLLLLNLAEQKQLFFTLVDQTLDNISKTKRGRSVLPKTDVFVVHYITGIEKKDKKRLNNFFNAIINSVKTKIGL